MVTPQYVFEVSRRIKEEYKFHGSQIRLPSDPAKTPLAEALAWHNGQKYLG